MNRTLIIAGNAHPNLAREIAELARLPLVPASITHFADGETRVVIEADVRKDPSASRCGSRYVRARGRTCVIVDDMASTGGTIAEAAQALSRASAAEVHALCGVLSAEGRRFGTAFDLLPNSRFALQVHGARPACFT